MALPRRGQGMFCIICKKHGVVNQQNKTDKFTAAPSDRFKSDAIETHKKSGRHQSASERAITSRMSVFHKEILEKKETEVSVLEKTFSTVYFLMKEYLSNRKFLPLISFMTNVTGVTEIKYFQYRSEGSVIEIFLTLGKVIKQQILKRVRAASCFGIMIDEMTDVSVTSQLITFVQYFDNDSGTVETKFLSVQDVLEEHHSVNASNL